MMDFNLRQLGYFIEVAERENISAAARALRMTQPALSRQMRAFEEDLGWQLLARAKKSVELTREGEIVLREGRRVMNSVEKSLQRMRNEIEGAEMRVGFAPSLASSLIEKAMRCFTQNFPKVRVNWFDCSTHEMWEKVDKNELDLIIEVVANEQAITWETLNHREFMLMVPVSHALANKRWVKPDDLNGERLLLLSRHDYPGYWERVTGYFSQHNMNAKIAGEFDGIASLRMGVEAGLGMAFVSDSTSVTPGVKLKKFRPKPDALRVGLGYKKGRVLAEWEQGFLDALRE